MLCSCWSQCGKKIICRCNHRSALSLQMQCQKLTEFADANQISRNQLYPREKSCIMCKLFWAQNRVVQNLVWSWRYVNTKNDISACTLCYHYAERLIRTITMTLCIALFPMVLTVLYNTRLVSEKQKPALQHSITVFYRREHMVVMHFC